jgi:hypothetical protein
MTRPMTPPTALRLSRAEGLVSVRWHGLALGVGQAWHNDVEGFGLGMSCMVAVC